ncbi:IclR family transcriptional regulator [Hydrogenophaga sp. BPS33]|uniref:IclR family transcriptional regulator n=1 Tax=Hydrogenophaga sp. BPS33 TaxID=2651974 RepID=UPI00131FD94D|nr:IclR family transcriptional regulator [Hydrogenophaga sp. BPS33]QHE87341.1 IclR family transcriptional regulator [Hydrogenophaga sp. BPS33]
MSDSPILKKGLEAVQIVALRGEVSARELADAMNLPKSTAHRLLTNLVGVRLLQMARRPEGDHYALGSLVGELSGAAFMWRPLVQHAKPELAAVRDDTGETVAIHMLYGNRRVLLDQVVSYHQLRWVYGHHMAPMPLKAGATGKMFLAMLEPHELEEVLRRELGQAQKRDQAKTLEALRAKIDAIRSQGYSISADELNPGITSIAVPVVQQQTDSLPRAVISLAAPSLRVTDAACKQYVRRLRQAARRIAASMAAAA